MKEHGSSRLIEENKKGIRLLVYSVYDKKSQEYMQPWFVTNKVQALRGFEEAVNTSGNLINKYPSDFALYYLGEFDINSGIFFNLDINVLEVEAMSYVSLTPVKTEAGNEVTRSVLQVSERSQDKKGV